MIPRLVAVLGLMVCALSAALLVPAQSEAFFCPPSELLIAQLLAVPPNIASDGGLMVQAVQESGGTADASFFVGPSGQLVLREGHFLVGAHEVSARVEPLASGLARVVPTEPIAGPATWVGATFRVPVRFEARPLALTRAPAISRASLRVHRASVGGRNAVVGHHLGVVLRREAPVDARALLVYEGDAHQAVAYTQLGAPSGRRIEVASGGPCSPRGWPFGWPAPRSRVRAAYVDESGRLSPLSALHRLR